MHDYKNDEFKRNFRYAIKNNLRKKLYKMNLFNLFNKGYSITDIEHN